MTENIQEEIENKIIDLIVSGAGGRLIVLKPENSDKSLVVEKRGDYKRKTISLNVYGGEFFGEQNLQEGIRKLAEADSINPDENFYLIFIPFDIVKQDIGDNFWLIPSLDLEKLAGTKESTGNFSKFLINKKDFSRFLFEVLEKK